MKANEWTATVDGHEIRATNHYTFLPPRTHETLEIDGTEVARGHLGWFALFSSLNVRAEISGRSRHIEARLGQKLPGFFVGCHILVDGALVGGDVDIAIGAPDKDQAIEEHRGGIAGLAIGRILAFGLPYAVMMSFLDPPDDPAWLIGRFLGFALMFGGGMAAIYWRSLRAQIRGYERCGVL